MYRNIKMRVCTLRFLHIHQDPCIQWKCVDTLRFFLAVRGRSSDIKESVTVGSIIVFSNGDQKMAANMANSSLPIEGAIISLVRRTRVYRAMTEEVPRERSRISGGNSSNVEKELSRNVQIPRVGARYSIFPTLFMSWPLNQNPVSEPCYN